ncbi:MAG TPA: hypothetical protein VKT21_01190 [Thermoplasmata archaeon]|nr:hypothetical protein [Thermoplasmata archaeon]
MELLDTFPAFERYWARVRDLPVRTQVERWESDYMSPWPELLEMQKDDYRRAGASWRRVARTRIFPHLPERLERLRRLHANLRRELPRAWSRTRKALGVDFEVQFVIYVGLGCGAGWATRLGGRPAVLFGLENAAEMTAGRRGEWPAAVSHEVAHLVHEEWRRRVGLGRLEESREPYWQLYEEGFATECERNIDDPKVFQRRTGRSGWLPWCQKHQAELAGQFLRDVRARRSVRRFFGSWYNIQGYTQSGYYLGAEAVRELKKSYSLTQIARLQRREVRRRMRRILEGFVAAGSLQS